MKTQRKVAIEEIYEHIRSHMTMGIIRPVEEHYEETELKPEPNNQCALLREIRRRVCELNALEYAEEDCPHSETCREGTCPACEAQLDRINRQLEKKRRRGEPVILDGLKEVFETNIDRYEH